MAWRLLTTSLVLALSAGCHSPPDSKPPDSKPPDPRATQPSIEGRWCEHDPEVGCYSFKGKTVIQHPTQTAAAGYSPGATGTWEFEGNDMLIMRFKHGNWPLQIARATRHVLVLKELDGKDTYTFTRAN